MALDDFATAAEMGTSAQDSELDEDIFDFPPMASVETAVAKEEAVSAVEAPVEEAPVEAAPTEAVEPEEPAAAAPDPVAAEEETVCTGLDPELDVDLFDFPPLEIPGASKAKTEAAKLEENIDQAAKVVNDLLEDDLSEMIDSSLDERPSPEEKSAPAPTPAPSAAPAPVAPVAPPAPVQVAAPAPLSIGSVAAPSGDPRIAWALTAAALVFIFGVLAIAWRATSNLGSSLDSLRSGLEEGNDRFAAQSETTLQRLTALEMQLLNQQKLAAQAAAGGAQVEIPPDLPAPHRLSLLVAEEAISKGQFSEARRQIFGLLATIDSLSEQDRQDVEHAAAYLVARSYQVEAEALEGDKR
jgi:hypothetical protein